MSCLFKLSFLNNLYSRDNDSQWCLAYPEKLLFVTALLEYFLRRPSLPPLSSETSSAATNSRGTRFAREISYCIYTEVAATMAEQFHGDLTKRTGEGNRASGPRPPARDDKVRGNGSLRFCSASRESE